MPNILDYLKNRSENDKEEIDHVKDLENRVENLENSIEDLTGGLLEIASIVGGE